MLTHCAQGEISTVGVERVVFEIYGHLAERHSAGLWTESQYLDQRAKRHVFLECDGGAVAGTGVTITAGVNENVFNVDLDTGHHGLILYSHIQHQILCIVCEAELLIYFAGGGCCLPTQSALEHSAS